MGEESERIEAFCEGQHSFYRKKSVGGLESADAAIGSRTDHGTSGLGSDREGRHAGRDRRSRPAGATARCVRQVARITRGTGRAVRELCGAGLTEEDRSAAAQIADNPGIGRADSSFVDRRAVFRRQAFGLDDVLHTEGDSGELSAAGGRLGRDLDPSLDGLVRIANPIDQELQGKLAGSQGSIGPLAEGFETGRVGGRDAAGCRKTGNEERASMHSQLLGWLGDSVAQGGEDTLRR